MATRLWASRQQDKSFFSPLQHPYTVRVPPRCLHNEYYGFLCSVDLASPYNLINRANYVPIIGRNNCICATLGICHSVWMTGMHTLHTRQSSTQNNKYQVSHRYSYFSRWWAHSCLKHVEIRNKHTKKNCAQSWLYLQENTTMSTEIKAATGLTWPLTFTLHKG